VTSEDTQILLLRTESEFIADPNRRSLEWWWDRMLSKHLVLPTFQEHARTHHWVERRLAFWRGVQAAWLRQKHVSLVQARVAELAEASELKGKVFQFIRPKVDERGIERFPIAPRSWEGMIKAYAILDDLVETKRAAILTSIEPMLAASEQEIAGAASEGRELPFNKDEMRRLAHNLLRERRKRRREELGIDDDDDREDDEQEPGAISGSGDDQGGMAGPV
jgi:hypothetical protein